ncbi:hypothetical protein C0Q70_05890 [Pomacea canaliculata]|uniref:Coiled-coil domain-containing protein 158 n=1 Tax=Pomacea canaliculata TaxID=400727 RepID=A0A2T7PMH6_POMCA|nr:hypothetical protein C0Q70_05890 [Pomacea canaliculata]
MDTVSCDSPLSNAFVHTSEAVAASVSVPPIVRSSTLSASYVITPSTFSTTPIVCTAPESSMRFSKYSSSHDFAEQIRQLEIEGNKLRSATLSALSQLGTSALNSSDGGSLEVKQATSPSIPSLSSSLADLSSDQKTITDLRLQLENQRRETERLQSQLFVDTSAARGFSNITFSSPFKSAFTTIPASELSAYNGTRRGLEFVPPSHLERALKESQEQCTELRKRLQEATDKAEQQKCQFRTNIEELKAKLHETIVNRDTVLELRQKEATGQEMLVAKLQSSLVHLQDKCRAQEEALSDVTQQAQSSSQTCASTTMLLTQLRTVLATRERARGQPYLEGEPVGSSLSASALVLVLERCLKELDDQVSAQHHKISQLEMDINDAKKTMFEREQVVIRDSQERLKAESEDTFQKLNQLTSEHAKRLEEANEQTKNARKQAAILQSQLQMLEEQQQQQNRMKNETIGELEAKLKQIKQDYSDDNARWQERRQALENSLDDVQRELIQARAEKTEAAGSKAVLDTKVEDLQLQLSRLENDLESERDRVRKQREREEELRVKALGLEGQLSNKQQEVERLERMLEIVKQEASAQMHDRVVSAEKQERDRYLDQVKTLSSQLSAANDKHSRLVAEYERTRMEAETLKQEKSDLRLDLHSSQAQGDALRTEKLQLSAQLEDQRSQVERLRHDLEHTRRLLEEKVMEAGSLRLAVEHATIQLEEKENILSTVRQQSSSITHLMEVNTRTSDNMREEREHLLKVVEAKTEALEEMKVSHDALSKKMKLREKRIKDLEEERIKVLEEAGRKAQELAVLQQEKDSLFSELRDSRMEVAKITQARDLLKREMAKLKNLRAKEVMKLETKLKEAEHEYKLTQRALKSKDSVDQKAVKVADKIQKEMTAKRSEVDSVRSKLRKLEEKYETLAKEKTMVERDKDSLKSSLAQSLLHSNQLTEELVASQTQNGQLTKQVKLLQDKLEKEAIKSASSQAQLEKYEQEIATIKLRHQLHLKETEQMTQNRIVPGVSWMIPTASKDSGTTSSSNSPRLTEGSCDTPPQKMITNKQKTDSNKQTADRYMEAGRELKALLGEMRQMIAAQKKLNMNSGERPLWAHSSPAPARTDSLNCRRSRSSSPDKGHRNHRVSLVDCSRSLTMSHPLRSEISSITADHHVYKGGDGLFSVPDTQELCRRLEEKIAHLTRMGNNLQQENQEMAHLISTQGEKLELVRKNERQMSDHLR